jgi:hypothetical protein
MRTAKKGKKGNEWLRAKPEKYERDTPYPRKGGGGPLSADPVFIEVPNYEPPGSPNPRRRSKNIPA